MPRRFALLVLATVLAGCADPAPARDDVPIPVGRRARGSDRLRGGRLDHGRAHPRVRAQPDGVHVRVVSHFDEPASVNGWGFDVDSGTSRWTFGMRPGVLETACWPFSDHGNAEPRDRSRSRSWTRTGLFVDGELDCAGCQSMGWVADYATPAGCRARRRSRSRKLDAELAGLDPGDEVRYAGYPEDPDPSVIVVRDGRVIAWRRVRALRRASGRRLAARSATTTASGCAASSAYSAPTRRATWNSVSACCCGSIMTKPASPT